MGLRSELATHLRNCLGEDVIVYEVGEDLVTAPAVIINPSDPYMAPTTMGAEKESRNQVGLELVLVVPRASAAAALNALEDLRLEVTVAIKTNYPAGRWSAFGQFGTVNVGGTDYASATLDVLFIDHSDRGATP